MGRMVARGGLKHHTREDPSILQRKVKRKKKASSKYRFHVPFLWRAFIACILGMVIIGGGGLMCSFGFFADEHSTFQHVNKTTNERSDIVDHRLRGHLKNSMYGGAVLMGFGLFVIVVSCVVVCEERDRQIKELEEADLEREKNKPSFYDAIIGQFKNIQDVTNTSTNGENNLGFQGDSLNPNILGLSPRPSPSITPGSLSPSSAKYLLPRPPLDYSSGNDTDSLNSCFPHMDIIVTDADNEPRSKSLDFTKIRENSPDILNESMKFPSMSCITDDIVPTFSQQKRPKTSVGKRYIREVYSPELRRPKTAQVNGKDDNIPFDRTTLMTRKDQLRPKSTMSIRPMYSHTGDICLFDIDESDTDYIDETYEDSIKNGSTSPRVLRIHSDDVVQTDNVSDKCESSSESTQAVDKNNIQFENCNDEYSLDDGVFMKQSTKKRRHSPDESSNGRNNRNTRADSIASSDNETKASLTSVDFI